MLPVITNAVFAIELYLKSLNAQIIILGSKVFAEVNCRGHSLTKLFKSVDKDIKNQVVSYYKKSKLFPTYTGPKAILKKYNDIYTKARFSFEKNSRISGTSLTELIKLVNSFHDFVDSLQSKEYIVEMSNKKDLTGQSAG